MVKDLPWPPDGYFAAWEISCCLLICVCVCVCVFKDAVSSTECNIECFGYFNWKGRGNSCCLISGTVTEFAWALWGNSLRVPVNRSACRDMIPERLEYDIGILSAYRDVWWRRQSWNPRHSSLFWASNIHTFRNYYCDANYNILPF
jgi:hypothetical protein